MSLLSFLMAAAAVGFVYAAVVPGLEGRQVQTRLDVLSSAARRYEPQLRRAGMSQSGGADQDGEEEALIAHELRVDLAKRSVRVRGQEVPTTFVEFEILTALGRSPGRVFTRDMLLTRIWGDSAFRDPRTIDVHIRHLREKLETDAKDPEYLFTVRGVGYRFRDDGDGS